MVIKEFEGTGNWILVKNERECGIKNPPLSNDPKTQNWWQVMVNVRLGVGVGVGVHLLTFIHIWLPLQILDAKKT